MIQQATTQYQKKATAKVIEMWQQPFSQTSISV